MLKYTFICLFFFLDFSEELDLSVHVGFVNHYYSL